MGYNGRAHTVLPPLRGRVTSYGSTVRFKDVQRYVRKGCGKNFSETIRKFWYNVKKKGRVSHYLCCQLSGYGLRRSVKKKGISLQTSFTTVLTEGFHEIAQNEGLIFIRSEKGDMNLRCPARMGRKVYESD